MFTTVILTFIFAWNEFLFATTFLFTPATQPVTVIIPNFASQYTADYGAQAAAAVMVTVPLVILVLDLPASHSLGPYRWRREGLAHTKAAYG